MNVARYTSAYSAFRVGLIEVDALRVMAAKMERKNALGLKQDINAVCRGAVVLLSAHLEAYIKDLGETTLDAIHSQAMPRTNLNGAFFYHVSKDLLDEVSDTREPSKIADKIFDFIATDITYWSRIGPFAQPIPAERFNKGFGNPAFDKIRSYFNRFGYQDYKSDLSSLLKANFFPTLNLIDHLVDTRNKIAHGDSGATKTPGEVRDMIDIVRRFGVATDSVFASWCKKSLCNIR